MFLYSRCRHLELDRPEILLLHTSFQYYFHFLHVPGKDGYIPTYDPSGEEYGEGPQFGCLQPHPNLLFQIALLVSTKPSRDKL